ncbi:MAG TPA: aldehyde dehydrogenase family protein [Bacteroidia bacterium]|nr:aldehyde dehydrogenase family protein [Bacteroidia bacterium]HNT80741.1 aldehyde dehydrogenase family protein [Bacteroidia bacterium]
MNTTKEKNIAKKKVVHSESSNGVSRTDRIAVRKTYKMFVNGQFIRSESGRIFGFSDGSNEVINISRASRKDFRDAVIAARNAWQSWRSKSAFNRSQILYRIAETLEGRKAQLVHTLKRQGLTEKDALVDIENTIDTFVYYAGWADKYVQVFSSVNPVEGKYFNFSFHESCGVVAIQDESGKGLSTLAAMIAASICGGNTCIVMASELNPMAAVELAEAIEVSDVPAGVCNLLTAYKNELAQQAALHMDVNALIYAGGADELSTKMEKSISSNLKRYVRFLPNQFNRKSLLNPYCILNVQEVKTTWHPISI